MPLLMYLSSTEVEAHEEAPPAAPAADGMPVAFPGLNAPLATPPAPEDASAVDMDIGSGSEAEEGELQSAARRHTARDATHDAAHLAATTQKHETPHPRDITGGVGAVATGTATRGREETGQRNEASNRTAARHHHHQHHHAQRPSITAAAAAPAEASRPANSSDTDTFLARLRAGDEAAALDMLTEHPALGRTPDALHLASSCGLTAVVALLLAARTVSVNARSAHGDTALHLAAYGGHVGIVGALLAAGADVHARTAEGATPLDLAAGQPHVRALLQRAGSGQ